MTATNRFPRYFGKRPCVLTQQSSIESSHTLPMKGPSPLRRDEKLSYLDKMEDADAQRSRDKNRRPIFLEDFADITLPFEVMRRRFTGDGAWLAPLASAATKDGEALRMRIGPTWAAGSFSREVRVTLGPSRERDDALVIPLAWESNELRSLFPLLEGDIELAPLGPYSCRVTLAASYVPPLGELGARLDHALLHRAAASTVRSFLSRVVANLQSEGDDPATPTAQSE